MCFIFFNSGTKKTMFLYYTISTKKRKEKRESLTYSACDIAFVNFSLITFMVWKYLIMHTAACVQSLLNPSLYYLLRPVNCEDFVFFVFSFFLL